MKTKTGICLVLLSIAFPLFGQGTFVNLDFEASALPTNSVGVFPVSAAFPGWTIYRANVPQSSVPVNVLLGAQSQVELRANIFTTRPLSGNFNAYLLSDPRDPVEVSLGQTGTIPLGMSTLQFRTGNFFPIPAGSLTVSFDSVPLFLQPVSQGGGYTLWSADISALAGLTGDLRFTALPIGFTWDFHLDDIAFVPVPEPGTWALLALGSALFACAARGRRR